MLLPWLAPALFTDRGVCLLPAGAGLLCSSLHRATQQLGPQHPQQLRVRSHCLDGSNRSVFCSPVRHFAPADLLCIPAGAGVYHEEQNEWSLCLCEKQRLPAAALSCALTVARNWCVHVGTDDPVFGIWKILGYMKVHLQSGKYLWNYKISEKKILFNVNLKKTCAWIRKRCSCKDVKAPHSSAKKIYALIAELNVLMMGSVGRCCSLSSIPGEAELGSTRTPWHCTNRRAGGHLQDNPQQAEALPLSCVHIIRVLGGEEIGSSKHGK